MIEAQTVPAKYIFLDVVDFSRSRSVEAQSDIVIALNGIVKASVSKNEVPNDKVIYLPTGDGICIALLNIESPFDIHLLIALNIVNGVQDHNEATENAMRKFKVRVGLNSNTDNLVTDINGNRNIAGAGVNVCQRVMSMADGNQILVSEAVYNTLRYREKYMASFEPFIATVKHNVEMPIYQFITEGHNGLNINIPRALIRRELPRIVRFAMWLNEVLPKLW